VAREAGSGRVRTDWYSNITGTEGSNSTYGRGRLPILNGTRQHRCEGIERTYTDRKSADPLLLRFCVAKRLRPRYGVLHRVTLLECHNQSDLPKFIRWFQKNVLAPDTCELW
jgi:hypothetical protein